MFVIIYQCESKSKIRIAPLLIPISSELLSKQVSYLQQLALTHFQDHLSPFIRKQHLQLSTQKYTMKSDYPIFVYCNFKQYIHNINCTLKPYDEAAALKRSYLLKYSVVIVDSNDYSERIVKQINIAQLDKLIVKESVYILGKEIQIIPKSLMNQEVEYIRKWSEVILQKWNKFQSPNLCVYILI